MSDFFFLLSGFSDTLIKFCRATPTRAYIISDLKKKKKNLILCNLHSRPRAT